MTERTATKQSAEAARRYALAEEGRLIPYDDMHGPNKTKTDFPCKMKPDERAAGRVLYPVPGGEAISVDALDVFMEFPLPTERANVPNLLAPGLPDPTGENHLTRMWGRAFAHLYNDHFEDYGGDTEHLGLPAHFVGDYLLGGYGTVAIVQSDGEYIGKNVTIALEAKTVASLRGGRVISLRQVANAVLRARKRQEDDPATAGRTIIGAVLLIHDAWRAELHLFEDLPEPLVLSRHGGFAITRSIELHRR